MYDTRFFFFFGNGQIKIELNTRIQHKFQFFVFFYLIRYKVRSNSQKGERNTVRINFLQFKN